MDLTDIRIKEHYGLLTNDTNTTQVTFLISPPKNRQPPQKHNIILIDHPTLGENTQILAQITEISSYEEVAGSTIRDRIGKMLATAKIMGATDLTNPNQPLQQLLTPPNPGSRIYMPYAQAVQDDRRIPAGMNLIVKTAGVAPRASDDLYRLAASANPNIPVGKVVRLDRLAGESISDLRTTTWILLSFAAVALILATIGIYGLVSYTVTQRTYEISLRMAIGATNGSIVRMILGQGLRVALAGMAAGLLAALFLTRALTALLFDTAPADPLIYACVSAFLFAVALAASLIPAWRASRVDPIRTLRAE